MKNKKKSKHKQVTKMYKFIVVFVPPGVLGARFLSVFNKIKIYVKNNISSLAYKHWHSLLLA